MYLGMRCKEAKSHVPVYSKPGPKSICYWLNKLLIAKCGLSDSILYRSQYTSSKKSQSPVSPKGISMNYPESSDSETGADSKRTWSASGYYSNEQSPRTRKKPSSAGSSRKRNTSLIKRTASMDSIDLLRSVPLASSGKGLSEKVATILILLNLDQANRPL